MINDKKYNKDKKANREQSGIALIMALGILSMLIVLALAFASTAITSGKMANYNANTTKARLLAEGAIERVVALANMYNADVAASVTPPTGVSIDVSYGESNDNDFIKDLTNDPDVKWTYVTAKENYYDNAGDPQERDVIIGRYAYIVTGNPTFIDPAACVEQGIGARDENGLVEDRLGIYLNEINLGNLGTPMAGSVLTNMSSKQSASGQLPDSTVGTTAPLPGNARWGDLDTMCTLVGIPLTGSDYDKCSNWFKFTTAKDEESFYTTDPEIRYKRFNLRRFTDGTGGTTGLYDSGTDTNWWDDPDNDGVLGSAGTDGPDHVNVLLSGAPIVNITDSGDTLCVPYLSTLFSNGKANNVNKGTFAYQATLAKQIAANLIDYCDTDDVPTSDKEVSTWNYKKTPAYTGNEKTPYINELSTQLDAQCVIVGPDINGNYSYSFTSDVAVGLEVIDMYNAGFNPADITADVYVCTQRHYYANDDNDPHKVGYDAGTKITIDFNGSSWSGSYMHKWETNTDLRTETYSSDAAKASIRTQLAINKVVLKYKGVPVDYAQIDVAPCHYIGRRYFIMQDAGVGITTVKSFRAWQVIDPRQNLNDDDWEYPTVGGTYGKVAFDLNADTATYPGTPNATNCNPSSLYDDAETTTSQAEVSTAYIRNDLMKSPWELGCIHRGIAGQTINLLRSHTETDMLDYDKGDANILDQIKMFTDDEVYGKFNINCGDPNAANAPQQKEALTVLFEGIHLGADYGAPATTGTPISPGDAMNYAQGLIDASGHGEWLRRSEVANVVALQVGDTDAKKEEFLGKFINLCKAKIPDLTIGTQANIIVLAQTIKDVGGVKLSKDLNFDGNIEDAATDTYDADGDGDTGDTVDETGVTTTYGSYEPMFDEITSQTVLIGKVELDTTGNAWKLKRYIYPE